MTKIICPNINCKELIDVVDEAVVGHNVPKTGMRCVFSGTYYKPQKVRAFYDSHEARSFVTQENPVRLVDSYKCEVAGRTEIHALVEVHKSVLSDASSSGPKDISKVN